MSENNFNHWYHGLIYQYIISPAQKPIYDAVLEMLEPDCTMVDIGCGTGGLTLPASVKCRKAIGLDLSGANIRLAEKEHQVARAKNLEFIEGSATELSRLINQKVDYAVASFVIHEMPPAVREKVMGEINTVTNNIIIAEYNHEMPKSFMSKIMYAAEFMAGAEHYKNFRNFIANGGAPALLEKYGFRIIEKKLLRKHTTVIYKAQREM